jgi:hypothetical protein
MRRHRVFDTFSDTGLVERVTISGPSWQIKPKPVMLGF